MLREVEALKEVISQKEDMNIKLEIVRGFLDDYQYEAVFYQRQDNFAWLTSGGHNGILYNSENGQCGLLVTRQVVYLITNSSEKPRVVNEEIASLPIQVIDYPWYEDINETVWKTVRKGRVASDTPLEGMDVRTIELSKLRFSLTELEQVRYRYLGETAATLMEKYCMSIVPGQTELEIAAGLNRTYLANGLLPTVTLVGCEDRIDLFRHPIATKNRFVKKCMVVSCVSYKGLVVALTRMVYSGKLPQALSEKFTLTAKVASELIATSTVGKSTIEIFDQMKKLYEDVGYYGEWQQHHQGGAIGYQNREYLVNATTEYFIQQNQAFAWNPSIKGTKSEDTIIVVDTTPEIITVSESGWPLQSFQVRTGETIKRPAILEI
ncbi:M24 family metallopeptidase [Anaerobacillus sp. CMMVII]|uniref:M24 family metallopeptidase n=1 Tax=Anaerobacillus sp. CMMVII TaxID=2755588 RepID=UPI0021B75C98|nr:aminopeptidase P family protein [Anaerobacillus sp. CMMVII]MCT8137097.1 M24 family metallopeptidase [Anaerobacillus sp. CMMVII]